MSEAEPVVEQTTPVANGSPGRALEAARIALNLSVADVSQKIKYGVKQIAAIEADDYTKLPGTTIVRGMIRSYAKLVQLDPEPLLAELGQRDVPVPVSVDLHTDEQEPFFEGGKKSNRVYGYLSVAALIAVAAVAYEWYTSPPSTGEVVTITPKVARTEAVAPEAPPVQAKAPDATIDTQTSDLRSQVPEVQPAPPAVVGKVSGTNRILLEFDQLSWVEVKQANGKILLSQLNPAGTRQLVEGVPPFELVIGNAANVRLKYNDKPVDLKPYFKVDVARLALE
jgi:cytoskeleton protein RodZ